MRKPFMALHQYLAGGVRMKTAWAVLILMIACLLAAGCHAEDASASRFQSVGGDYGRSVIGSMTANETQSQTEAANNSTLWNWGNAPKGSMAVGGKLVDDPSSNINSIDVSDGSVSVLGVDTFTGNTIYYYRVPNTSTTRYFYVDPYTGNPVYVEKGNFVTEQAGTGSTSTSSSYSLPPAFR
jgi:hypothetical protein